jgi:hypothetical protein
MMDDAPGLTVEDDGAIEWKIDEIIDAQFDSRGKLWYEVQWFGYGVDENTWEPAYALQKCAAVEDGREHREWYVAISLTKYVC